MNTRILIQSCLLLIFSLFSKGTFAAPFCDKLFHIETRQTTDLVVDYYDDQSYLEMHRRRQAMGIMTSRFDSELDTRIYHGNTGLPDLNTGELPVVDPRARGLFVFLHGSGTMGATGKNFVSLMNTMWDYGLAGISFDLPYHADGPINERFESPTYFMNWIRKVIAKYRVPGIPVYLIGHSYGAELTPEYMARFPGDVDGGLSISLVGFTPVLKNWYLKKTKNMNFDGVVTNSAGDKWADGVSEKFTWNQHRFLADNLRVLVGDHEEYVPGPTKGRNGKPSGPNTYDYKGALLNIIPNAQVTVEKGVGHYIFDHVDSNGRHAITREILLTAGLDPSLMDKKTNKQERSLTPNTDSAIQKYASDPFFRSWVQNQYRSSRAFFQMIRKGNETLSMKILKSYDTSKKAREAELNL